MKNIIYAIAFLPIIGTQISCTKEKIVEVEKKVEVEKIVEVEVEKQSESPEDVALFNAVLQIYFDGNLTYNGKGNFIFIETIAYITAEAETRNYSSERRTRRLNNAIALATFNLNDVEFLFNEIELVIKSQNKIYYYTYNNHQKQQTSRITIPYIGGYEPDRERLRQIHKEYESQRIKIRKAFQHIKQNKSITGFNFDN